MRFGISTHIFAEYELLPLHLSQIHEAEFTEIELYANRPHFPFEKKQKVVEIARGLQNTGLKVNSMHAPFYSHFTDALKGNWLSICSPEEPLRQKAVQWIKRSLKIADYINIDFLVIHFGGEEKEAKEIYFQQAAKSLRELQAFIKGERITIALENITNSISSSERIINFLKDYDFSHIGICFDVGHSFLAGNLLPSFSRAAKSILTCHIHDNSGQADEHLVPFAGAIEWSSFLTKLREEKFDGCLVFEPKGEKIAQNTLLKCKAARQKLEAFLKKNND